MGLIGVRRGHRALVAATIVAMLAACDAGGEIAGRRAAADDATSTSTPGEDPSPGQVGTDGPSHGVRPSGSDQPEPAFDEDVEAPSDMGREDVNLPGINSYGNDAHGSFDDMHQHCQEYGTAGWDDAAGACYDDDGWLYDPQTFDVLNDIPLEVGPPADNGDGSAASEDLDQWCIELGGLYWDATYGGCVAPEGWVWDPSSGDILHHPGRREGQSPAPANDPGGFTEDDLVGQWWVEDPNYGGARYDFNPVDRHGVRRGGREGYPRGAPDVLNPMQVPLTSGYLVFNWSFSGTLITVQFVTSGWPDEYEVVSFDRATDELVVVDHDDGRQQLWIGCGSRDYPLAVVNFPGC